MPPGCSPAALRPPRPACNNRHFMNEQQVNRQRWNTGGPTDIVHKDSSIGFGGVKKLDVQVQVWASKFEKACKPVEE